MMMMKQFVGLRKTVIFFMSLGHFVSVSWVLDQVLVSLQPLMKEHIGWSFSKRWFWFVSAVTRPLLGAAT